jgi:tetratricopeptide (TPR) repeat protein
MNQQRRAVSDPSSALIPLLAELDLPWNAQQISRRIRLCRRALDLLPAAPATALRASVLQIMAELRAAQSGGTGRGLDEALATYDQAAALFASLGLTRDLARACVNIARLCLSRPEGGSRANIQRALSASELAFSLLSPEVDAEAWVAATINLAAAYRRSAEAGRGEGQERALALLLHLLESRFLTQHGELHGRALNNLAGLYLERLAGDLQENLQLAIVYGEQALGLRRRDRDARAWAQTTHNLAVAWAKNDRGDRAENLERAISLFRQALEVRTREALPWDWAHTLDSLGTALADRIRGNRPGNLEEAIACHEQALTIRRRSLAPDLWAATQINRALAYVERIDGDRTANLELSIRISRQVLGEIERDAMPVAWAAATVNLSQALEKRLLGDRADNIEQAIELVESTLDALDRSPARLVWARALNTLGNAYESRIRGDRSDNVEKAISLYDEALKVRRRESAPWDWAETMHNLAIAHFERPRQRRSQEIETAISLAEACLAVYTREAAAERWSVTLFSLATFYLHRLLGLPRENVERAISYLDQALIVRTRAADPFHWASTASRLGTAYWRRHEGDREDNLDHAVYSLGQALEVQTRRRTPLAWAETQSNMGLVWATRQRGDPRENRRQAARAYRRALTVLALEALPEEHQRTCRNLGNLHFAAGRWRNAGGAYAAAIAAGDLLYAQGATPHARNASLRSRQDSPLCAAFALAKRRRRAEAVRVLEAGRVREIRDGLERGERELQTAAEPDRGEIIALRRRIASLEGLTRRDPGISAREYLAFSTELREANSALRSVVARVVGSTPGPVVSAADALPVGLPNPVVYLVTTLHGTLALVLNPGAQGDGEIDSLYLALRQPELTAIIEGGGGRGSFLESALADRGGALASTLNGLWEPLRAAVVLPLVRHLRRRGYDRALVVPCGRLGLLPLPAMALDEMALAYGPSAGIAIELAARSRPDVRPVLLAVGNPLSEASSLPLAELEVEACAETVGADSRRLLVGNSATRSALLAALPGSTHLHFACHGVFDLATPLDSALLLAGGDRLTVRDLLDGGIDLSAARLAVLSACQTALSDQEIPDEILGFPAALLRAGVPSVIGTLWHVGDLAASLLLAEFYRRQRDGGESTLDALRGAQARLRDGTLGDLGVVDLLERAFERSGRRDRRLLELLTLYGRKPADSRPFAAPQHWAGFVLWGGSL